MGPGLVSAVSAKCVWEANVICLTCSAPLQSRACC